MGKPKKKVDRHKSGFLVRFPESYRAAFQMVREKLGQAYTVAGQRAMDAYLKANGLPPPGGST